MSTKSYILIPHCLQDHNIQIWQKSFFSLCPTGTIEFWRKIKPFFKVDIGMCLSIFLFLSESSTCAQDVWRIEKNIIFHKGYVENSHIKAIFWQCKRHIKNYCIENPNCECIYSSTSPTQISFLLLKKIESRFLVAFQSSSS
jgi:hypothetical protein